MNAIKCIKKNMKVVSEIWKISLCFFFSWNHIFSYINRFLQQFAYKSIKVRSSREKNEQIVRDISYFAIMFSDVK